MLYLAVTAILLLVTASILTYYYKDKIINLFVQEVNKNLLTPISVVKIDLSIFEKFPHLSVNLDNVVIQENSGDSKLPLAQAKHIYCTFSLIGLLRGDYTVKQIFLEDAEVFLKIDKNGNNNYTIIDPSTGESTGSGSVSFNLEKIKLDKVLVNYSDEKRDQYYSAFAEDIAANLFMKNDIYDFEIKGNLVSKKIQIEGDQYFHDKPLYLDTRLQYEDENDKLTIMPSRMKVSNSNFKVDGYFTWKETDKIDINVEGENTDIQTIFSLLPENIINKYKVYSSKGEVYFNGKLTGEISKTASPALTINFGCNNASFSHPDFKKGINNVTLKGVYTNPKVEDLTSAVLELNNIEGILEGKKFTGNMMIRNFKDYYVKGNVNAELNLGSVLKFYPVEKIKSAEGVAVVKMSLNGRLNDLKSISTTQKMVTAGEIILKDLDFNLTSNNLPFKDFNGSFIFRNNDLGISDFSGNIGSSKFLINGFFKNIIAFVVFKDQPISIEADLSSEFLDFNELLSGNVSDGKEAEPGEHFYSFEISPKLQFSFNCDVQQLNFRRFHGEAIKGQLKVKDQIALTQNVNVNSLGGKMEMNASVDARNKDRIILKTISAFERISIDSIFYIFENFNQDFLVKENLKGQIDADLTTSMIFDSKLRLNPSSIVSDLEFSIKNGELNDFEPMQNLSRFVEEKNLARLKFSELKNKVHIEKQTIFLPPMEIRSNVSTILIGGTHTFDQHIDYRLQVPLRSLFRKVKDTGDPFGAVEENNGQTKLFLTIKGTTDDYKIGYDAEAVKQKIKQDVKKEGKELKEAFQNKGKEKQAVELEEEEYFDF
ncbi:hypothetical protein BH23BAC1_BH23BAC1_34470 [soil metagenome]